MQLTDGPWTLSLVEDEESIVGLSRIVSVHNRIYNELLEQRKISTHLVYELEKLTPGGSEFSSDPDRCLDFIRSRLDTAGQVAADRHYFAARLERARCTLEGLLEYRDKNLLNIQMEKLDDYLRELRRILSPQGGGDDGTES